MYLINVFYGILIAVYFLPFKKNHPVGTFNGTLDANNRIQKIILIRYII